MSEQLTTAAKSHREGRYVDAERLYRDYLRAYPANTEVLLALGHVCYQQGKLTESIACLEQACKVEPADPELHFTLGNLISEKGDDPERALACYRQAVILMPDYGVAWLHLGVAYYHAMNYSAAAESLSRAAVLDPRDEKTFYNLGLALMRSGRAAEAGQMLRRARDIAPNNSAIHTCLLFNLHHVAGLSNREIFDEHLRWAARFGAEYPGRTAAAQAPARTRLRVGYISPDFRTHSVFYFIHPIVKEHDRATIECYCYSDVTQPDDLTRKLMNEADHWRDISGLDDDQAFRLIQQDGIDILVDLAGHTDRNRLRMLSRKAAPVQVSYLGYPDTTGLRTVDYRLTDEWADPEGVSDDYYTEKLVRLENGFLCYEPPVEPPFHRSVPARQNGFVTFGSYNNLAKINGDVILAWSDILRQLPGAKLLLKARGLGDPSVRATFLSEFRSHGIGADRIECLGHMIDVDQHLDAYNRMDVALDTFPYNGTATTCEALWMGVPVITFTGERHASRVGTSLLTSIGLTDCIAGGRESYIDLAVQLARDVDKLEGIRAGLRERMRSSPLMDAAKFCRTLERKYRLFAMSE
ncbi:MAG TPA: tetratricopeptide repeat protein [Acidobacteriota bacterium]|nr:tetratricopeptide repeat protein [Acidobacteriota bacterium]